MRIRLLVPFLLLPSAATSQATNAAVDSATVGRAAWQRARARAGAALRGNDLVAARKEIDRAAQAWPTQIAYLQARALLAARVRDTAAMLDALGRIADLGLGIDIAGDTTYRPFDALPAFASVARRHAENLAPMVRSTVVATLQDSTTWPEGIDADTRTGKVYVGSIRHHTIVERLTDGSERELISRRDPLVGGILGVHVDTTHGVVWATTAGIPQMEGYAPADSGIAGLLRVRISDGAIERRWMLPPSARGHTLGDVTQARDGTVYTSDSRDPVLYRLRPGVDTLEAIRHPLFRNLQGMAPTPDGSVVYVADYSHGLLRVDTRTGWVSRLPDAPNSTSLGCDGIVWYRGSIIAVQNGVYPARIMRFVLDDRGTRIVRAELLDRNSAVADEPTIGAIVGSSFVYVANSQWDKHDDAGVPRPGVARTRPVLLSVPLSPR